jgi:two-component system sensor histidine kinase DegS
MTDAQTTSPPASLAQLSSRLVDDARNLDAELKEVDLLVEQAKSESARHVARRAAAADKLAALQKGGSTEPKDLLDLSAQLVTLTKRAALMESQVDVLEGKRRALGRYREAVAEYASVVAMLDPTTATGSPDEADAEVEPAFDPDDPLSPAVSRIVMSAQEDLRREISRAMHDGPAQSLTNIVLQAQIVERLVTKDPASAHGEVRQLIAMVQQTLDATKSFIFDVRPMVLDDLGLLPTLRRAARERGRRAGITVDFDSMGQDRRLPPDLESGLFRIVDEALAAYMGLAPDRVSLKLEWTAQVEVRVAASRTPLFIAATPPPVVASDPKKKSGKEAPAEDLPPALAAMIEERMADERDAAEVARLQAIVIMPPATWREIQNRAASIGVTAELLDEGAQLMLLTEAAPAEA